MEKQGRGKEKAPRHGSLRTVLLLLTNGLARSQILIFEGIPREKKTNRTLNKAKPEPLAVEIQMF